MYSKLKKTVGSIVFSTLMFAMLASFSACSPMLTPNITKSPETVIPSQMPDILPTEMPPATLTPEMTFGPETTFGPEMSPLPDKNENNPMENNPAL